jgi:membrane protease YdiL (CAAX protease family)
MKNDIYRSVQRVEEAMVKKPFFRNVVLAVVIVNFVGFTIMPLLLILLGEHEDSQLYINLLFGAGLTTLLIYCGKNAHRNNKQYFAQRVPGFLIASYFIVILIAFVVKTVSILFIPILSMSTVYSMVIMQLYVWPILDCVLFAWQLYMLYRLNCTDFTIKYLRNRAEERV